MADEKSAIRVRKLLSLAERNWKTAPRRPLLLDEPPEQLFEWHTRHSLHFSSRHNDLPISGGYTGLLYGVCQLRFILIVRQRNDLRDPTSFQAAARS